MIVVYIILGIIIIGSFVSGIVLIIKEKDNKPNNTDILYDAPKELLDDSNDDNEKINNLGNVSSTDDSFDDEII